VAETTSGSERAVVAEGNATSERPESRSPGSGVPASEGSRPSSPEDGASRGARPAEPSDDLVETTGVFRGPTGSFEYVATAGRVVLREEVHTDGRFDGHRARAELFVVSYVRRGVAPSERPVVFAFNGGPGSSSVWLHLGLLGPRRVDMGDVGALVPPPYGLLDNHESLLAHADLVFIDPVSTGYSRVVEGAQPSEFHGFRRDLESVGELIRLWTTREGRWLSPKYLIGESYGTLRASALAHHLSRRYGLVVNGVGLVSSVLDMGTIRFTEGNDLPYVLYLPTYAALARYHGVAHEGRPLVEVCREAEEFASGAYAAGLAKGARLPAEERRELLRRLSALIGLGEDYLDRADLRVEHQRFFRELLRRRGQVIGRLDGRFVGYEADDVGERPSVDPSNVAISGPYAAAINHYLHHELGYRNELPYELLTDRVRPWSYKEFEGRHVSVAGDLAAAMRENPSLRVYVGCGYYDGATPYYAAEHVLAHLAIPPDLRANIDVRYYEAGHMTYVHEPSRLAQSADLARLVARHP